MATEKKDATSGAELDLTGNRNVFDDAALAGITSLDDALSALAGISASTDSIADYGNGFEVCKEKQQLIGKAFVIVQWRFNTDAEKTDFGPFVSAAIVTEAGEKLILNDGSTGVYKQLMMVTAKRETDGVANTQSGLICKGGLRESAYPAKDANGNYLYDKNENAIQGTTYYLA